MLEALDALLAVLALAVAVALRPWRGTALEGPPWFWFAWGALMAFFWVADRFVAMPVAQPLSGVCLLMLMMGWPLAVLALPAVALLAAFFGDLSAAEALHRAVWLGVMPATLALAGGAAIRRWLPHQLFVYILGRGFLLPVLALAVAGGAGALLAGAPSGLSTGDLLLGRWLAAWGDAWLCGMFVAIFVAFRPEWLATYADRIWLVPKQP